MELGSVSIVSQLAIIADRKGVPPGEGYALADALRGWVDCEPVETSSLIGVFLAIISLSSGGCFLASGDYYPGVSSLTIICVSNAL